MIDIKTFGFNISNKLSNQLLSQRGIFDEYSAKKFFHSPITEIKKPINLPSINIGTERIIKSVNKNEKIGIFGDFDADGLTGTAIIARTIKKIGGEVIPYIPNRDKDGHGLSEEAVKSFYDANVKLIITVDTGSTALKETKLATELGIDTIITDHHIPPGVLPTVVALINPMLNESIECEYSGSGVAFKLSQALCDKLNLDFPEELLPLAAIGTIADSSPLIGENRNIVKNGLEILARTKLAGVKTLLEKSKSDRFFGKPNTELVSFQLAPRLNAPGRLGDSEPALQILMTDNNQDAIAISDRLDDINNQRKEYSTKAWEMASIQIETQNNPIISVELSDVPLGILGPTAGKIVDQTGKPAIVFQNYDDLIKASCRSNEYIDIHKCLYKSNNLLNKFGGHAAAAGFTVSNKYIDEVIKIANETASKNSDIPKSKPFQPDAVIDMNELTPELWKFIRAMEPYGKSNPEPLFHIKSAQISNIKNLGINKNHLKLNLITENKTIEGIGFGLGQTPLGSGKVDITFRLSTNNWRGRIKDQIEIKDIVPSKIV